MAVQGSQLDIGSITGAMQQSIAQQAALSQASIQAASQSAELTSTTNVAMSAIKAGSEASQKMPT